MITNVSLLQDVFYNFLGVCSLIPELGELLHAEFVSPDTRLLEPTSVQRCWGIYAPYGAKN